MFCTHIFAKTEDCKGGHLKFRYIHYLIKMQITVLWDVLPYSWLENHRSSHLPP